MTEAEPDKPSRSVFVPGLVVVVVICAGFLLLIVPLWDCGIWGGDGRREFAFSQPGQVLSSGTLVGDGGVREGTGIKSLLDIWRREAEESP